MKRLNVNILLSFLNGYSHWSLSKKFGSYVLKFDTDSGVKQRIKKFNPRKFDGSNSINDVPPDTIKKGRQNNKRQRIPSGEGNSEADYLSWDDYDVANGGRVEENERKEEEDAVSVLSSSSSSKESSPEMHREGKLLLMEMKELRKEIKKMGDTSVLNSSSKECPVQLLTSDYTVRELEEMMSKMEEENCWDSGYAEKEFSSDKEGGTISLASTPRFKEFSSEQEDPYDEDEDVPFELEEVSSDLKARVEESASPIVELTEGSKTLKEYVTSASTSNPQPISKSQKKKLKRQRAKLRNKNVHRYTAPIAPSERNSAHRLSPFRAIKWAHLCADCSPTPDKEIVRSIDHILGTRTVKELTPTPVIKGRKVSYKNLFAWEVSFCDTKERYRELLNKKFERDQTQLQSILQENFKYPTGIREMNKGFIVL